jgi:hypothetical protein
MKQHRLHKEELEAQENHCRKAKEPKKGGGKGDKAGE